MKLLEAARNYLFQRQRAYKLAFNGESGRIILEDLARFCRASETCFHPDPRIHAVMEGRREVWLRITEHLNLSQEELANLHIQRKIND